MIPGRKIMKHYGHNLKPLNAKIRCIGTAYGEGEDRIKKLQKKLAQSP